MFKCCVYLLLILFWVGRRLQQRRSWKCLFQNRSIVLVSNSFGERFDICLDFFVPEAIALTEFLYSASPARGGQAGSAQTIRLRTLHHSPTARLFCLLPCTQQIISRLASTLPTSPSPSFTSAEHLCRALDPSTGGGATAGARKDLSIRKGSCLTSTGWA